MKRSLRGLVTLVGAGTLLTFSAIIPHGQAFASDSVCASHSQAATQAPDTHGFTKLATRNLYRFQDRPWARLPVGAAIKVRAPQGMSEADVHNAARCGLIFGNDAASPLTVPGAKLVVKHHEGAYELHITAKERGPAREIQQRAEALR
jgi:hypothetical protein